MPPILRCLLLPLLCLAFAQAQADTLITNASELRDALRGSAQAAELEELTADRGCGPAGCVIDLAELRIQREQGLLQRIDGQPLRWQQAGDALPELDWSPLAAYRVSTAGKPWGLCLEFSHSGIGKSGLNQRWTSLVLVPYNGNQPGPAAYRIVGYWTGCDSLQVGEQPGQLVLPVISQNTDQPLQLRRYHCSVNACDSQPASQQVQLQDSTLRLLAP
ncbi:MAG: hypothetical protein AAGC84_17275 [Pseudomonas sp.]